MTLPWPSSYHTGVVALYLLLLQLISLAPVLLQISATWLVVPWSDPTLPYPPSRAGVAAAV